MPTSLPRSKRLKFCLQGNRRKLVLQRDQVHQSLLQCLRVLRRSDRLLFEHATEGFAQGGSFRRTRKTYRNRSRFDIGPGETHCGYSAILHLVSYNNFTAIKGKYTSFCRERIHTTQGQVETCPTCRNLTVGVCFDAEAEASHPSPATSAPQGPCRKACCVPLFDPPCHPVGPGRLRLSRVPTHLPH